MMSFITEFMRMDVDRPPVNTEPKKFRYRGELRYPIANKHDPDVCIKISDDGRWYHCEATENDVFKISSDSEKFNLYVWTGKHTGWQDFHPGPVTDYDGPRPYNDTPNDKLLKVIQDKTEILYKKLNISGKYGLQETDEKRIWITSQRLFDGGYPTSALRYSLKYIGETDTNVRDNPRVWLVQIIHRTGSTTIGKSTIRPLIGFVVSYKDVEYVYTGPETGWVAINDHKNQKEEFTMPVRYERIFPKLNIKNVVFNNPATVVFWDDGTKTVVKCENEEYDPEKGLAMAIAKKALGNQGNYYNQIRKWLPEKDKEDNEPKPVYRPMHRATILGMIQNLIIDMTFKGATKAELTRAIKYSKEVIDLTNGADIDLNELEKEYGIKELKEKYQPKSK